MLGSATVRRAAVAVVAVCALASCTVGRDGGTGDGLGASPGVGDPAPAEGGRYSALPEPCGTVGAELLQELLPEGEPADLRGEPVVTYDTERRVGCTWEAGTDGGRHRLTVDFERVISYDPLLSDDDQAALDFRSRAAEAGVALPEPEGEDEDGETGEDEGSGGGEPTGDGEEGEGGTGVSEQLTEVPADGTSASPSQGAPAGALAPRPLEGIGSAAYVDDHLTQTLSGVRRQVALAFRSANVIVTVHYAESASATEPPPDSAAMQQGARGLAEQLAENLEG